MEISFLDLYFLCWKLIDEAISYVLGQVKKNPHFSRPDFYKKESGLAVFLVIYYLLLHAFLIYYYLPPCRDTLELLGQILIERNID